MYLLEWGGEERERERCDDLVHAVSVSECLGTKRLCKHLSIAVWHKKLEPSNVHLTHAHKEVKGQLWIIILLL